MGILITLVFGAVTFVLGDIRGRERADQETTHRTTIADTASVERGRIAEDAEEDRAETADRIQDEALRIAHVSRERPLPRIQGDRVAIISGTTAVIGRGFDGSAPPGLRFHPLTYRVTDEGELFISGEIHDRRGLAVVRIVESRVYVPAGVRYDVNWSRSALEVVDPRGDPVLQVIASRRRNAIVVNWASAMPRGDGVSYQPVIAREMALSVGGVEEWQTDSAGSASIVLTEDPTDSGPTLDPIFCYPGYRNSGLLRSTDRCR